MSGPVVRREFPYRGRAPLLVLLLFWGCVLASLAWAWTGRGPFQGNDGRVTVGESSARIVRWTAFALCGGLAVLASRWAWIDRFQGRRVALADHGLLLPRARWGWFSEEVFVAYADISDCQAMVIRHVGAKPGVSRLRLRSVVGRFAINRDHLPEGAFEELCRALASAAKGK
jgi:hypothetical protein